ncbi:MAG: leucine-rich repeat domain-containing protein [Oscillospiraceae bacterium]|nr:leucine-rich repeat domain-containing protein [Oscillospiraceae bacterium]
MTYSDEELFDIIGGEYDGKAFVWRFLKGSDPEVTSIVIPAEYKGYPVTSINRFSFSECEYLQEVVIPDSVENIYEWAFEYCPNLRSVRLPKNAEIGMHAFKGCPKLSAEVIMAGLIGSAADLTAPFDTEDFLDEDCIFSAEDKLDWTGLLRTDVFELTIKYDSFRDIGTKRLFEEITRRGLVSHFAALERAGRFPGLAQTDGLIEWCIQTGSAEMTAYLLDFKRRKFGFDKEDDYVL